MSNKSIARLGIVLAVLLLTGSAVVVNAQSNGYKIDWWTGTGGGGAAQSADDTYTLHGTVGQPDAGTLRSADDTYALTGGFWGGAATEYDIFLPLVLRNHS
jgi:hypothetical protein